MSAARFTPTTIVPRPSRYGTSARLPAGVSARPCASAGMRPRASSISWSSSIHCAAREDPLCSAPPAPSERYNTLGPAGSKLPSSRITAPWPPMIELALPAEIRVKPMPSIRATGITIESGLKASVTSNSGRTAMSRVSPSDSRSSRVPLSPETSSMPMPVTPPNRVGVSGRPLASTTCASPADRPAPIAAIRPLRTSTSVFCSEPCAPAVWTVAPRISSDCAAAGSIAVSSAAMTSRRDIARGARRFEAGRLIAHLHWPRRPGLA